jgi:hypothetical protein
MECSRVRHDIGTSENYAAGKTPEWTLHSGPRPRCPLPIPLLLDIVILPVHPTPPPLRDESNAPDIIVIYDSTAEAGSAGRARLARMSRYRKLSEKTSRSMTLVRILGVGPSRHGGGH